MATTNFMDLSSIIRKAVVEETSEDRYGVVVARIYRDPRTGKEVRRIELSNDLGNTDLYLDFREPVSAKVIAKDFYAVQKTWSPDLRRPKRDHKNSPHYSLDSKDEIGVHVYEEAAGRQIRLNTRYIDAERVFIGYAQSFGLARGRTKVRFSRDGVSRRTVLTKRK